MAARQDDPLSGLLMSGLSGMESSAFRKNESMANARSRQTAPAAAKPATSPSVQSGLGMAGRSPAPGGYRASPTTSAPPSGLDMLSPGSTSSGGSRHGPMAEQGASNASRSVGPASRDPFLASQLDAFSGLGISSGPLSMAAQKKAVSGQSRTPVVVADSAASRSTAMDEPPSRSSLSMASSAPVHEDLDAFFGPPSTSGPATAPEDVFGAPPSSAPSHAGSHLDLADWGFSGPARPAHTSRSEPNLTGDPFAASPVPSPAAPTPPADDPLDFFGGASSAPSAARGSTNSLRSLSSRASGTSGVPAAAAAPARSGSGLGAADDEFGQFVRGASPSSAASKPGTVPLSHQDSDGFPSFERAVPQPQPPRQPEPAPAPPVAPPAARGGAAPAAEPATSSGGMFFERLDAEGGYFSTPQGRQGSGEGLSGEDEGPPPPPYDQVMGGSSGRGGGGSGTSGALSNPPPAPASAGVHGAALAANAGKQAAKLGRWLGASATKLAKVAQAKAKEVTSHLHDLDISGHARRGSYGERFDDDADDWGRAGGGGSGGLNGGLGGGGGSRLGGSSGRLGGSSASPHAASGAGGGFGGAGGGGGGDEDDIPAHYYEWAATLANIADAADRQRVLDGMPEEDAAVLTRLLRQQGVEAGESAARPAREAPAPAPRAARAAAPSERPAAAASPPPPPAARAASADLLGVHAAPAAAAAAAAPPPARVAAPVVHDDLLGMGHGGGSAPAAASAAPAAPAAAANGAAGLDNFFSGGWAAAAAPARSAQHDEFAAMFGAAPGGGAARSGGATGDAMIDFGDFGEGAAGLEDYADMYQADEGDAGEPEMRRAARQKRLAEMHARMRQKLAAKQQMDEAEHAEKAAKVELRHQLQPRIDAWSNQKKDNIRALLSSLHTVLWEDSGWTQPSMSDMVQAPKVRRWYMKANLIVHPDKVKQKGGSVEQVTIADMVFDVLKQAWAKFEAAEMR